jgi:hypothetical protein
VNGQCAISSDGSGSIMWDWPNLDIFDTDLCEGTPTSVDPFFFPTTCVASNATSGIDSLTYFNYSLINPVVAVPSFQPSSISGTDSNSNSNDDSMSSIGGTGGLAGIAAGGAVVICVLLGVVYYYIFYKPAQSSMKSPLMNGSQV